MANIGAPIKLKTYENKGGNLELLNLTEKQLTDYSNYSSDYMLGTPPRVKPVLDSTQLKTINDYFKGLKDKKSAENDETPYKLVVNQLHSFKSVFEKNSKKLNSSELQKVLNYVENILPNKKTIDDIIKEKAKEEAKAKAEQLQKEIDEAAKLLKEKQDELKKLTTEQK